MIDREQAIEVAVKTLASHVGAGFFEDGWGQARIAEIVDAILALPERAITDEMVERAAEAIWNERERRDPVNLSWQDIGRLEWSDVVETRADARAALLAALDGGER